jgi:signal transduction histidine kinase
MDERRLKILLAVFFLALAIPSVVLVAQAYGQLKWEAFRQTQLLAEDLAARIEADLRSAVAAEEARSFSDYAFLVVEGDAAANFVQRSTLSSFPVVSAVPGALGYFQVNADGELTTPLLPAGGVDAESYGISVEEHGARLALETTIRDVLVENRLVQRSVRAPGATGELRAAFRDAREQRTESQSAGLTVPAEAPSVLTQAAFDRLKAGESVGPERSSAVEVRAAPRRVGELLFDQPFANRASDAGAASTSDATRPDARQKRTEQALAPEPAPAEEGEREGVTAGSAELRVRMFESELEPFEVGLLDTGHIVMFRSAWRDGQRYIQGLVVDREGFIARAVDAALGASSLAGVGDLIVAYGGNVLGASGAAEPRGYPTELAGSLLHRARMSPPFGDLELIFSVNELPRAAGSVLLAWVTVTLAAVLCGGFFFMYRFAAGQIRLTRQQQDFVSAVSHELKTPLTSIRMYGEMLKAGWADDAKKQTYYDYIHGEAERLSRLIENVLQLARLTRNASQFDMKRVTVAELLDIVRSRVGTQVERAGFGLELRDDAGDAELMIDADCFTQIMINLVDNALKFSAAAERKVIEIACRRERDGGVLFTVRDFGPGIPKGKMKKIFELFYRPPSTLTRETAGTGIGLALVQQLVTAMNGRVEARNCQPGAEFRLGFESLRP